MATRTPIRPHRGSPCHLLGTVFLAPSLGSFRATCRSAGLHHSNFNTLIPLPWSSLPLASGVGCWACPALVCVGPAVAISPQRRWAYSAVVGFVMCKSSTSALGSHHSPFDFRSRLLQATFAHRCDLQVSTVLEQNMMPSIGVP